MKNNNPMGSDDQVPEILFDQNPLSRGKGMDGVQFDNNQWNGKHGSPMPHKAFGHGLNEDDFGGINYDNEQVEFGSIEMYSGDGMEWQKKMGVFIDPTKKFTEKNEMMSHEVDLKNDDHESIGMPADSEHESPRGDCSGY
jgi:hypothetical protein